MKWILSLVLLVSLSSIAQEDSTKYIWYKFQYGQRMPRGWWDSTAQLPYRDTNYTPARPGAIVMRPVDKQFYKWNGEAWSVLAGGSSYTGPFNAPATGDTLVNSDKEVKRLNPGYGILHDITGTNITQRVDTASSTGVSTKSMLRDTAAAIRADMGTGGTVNYSNTAFVDSAHGNDGTGQIDRADKPFATIDAALDAGASKPSLRLKIAPGSYAAPTPAKMRNYLWIQGSGKPGHNGVVSMTAYATFSNTAPTHLKGGTIIRGKVQSIDKSFVKITDLGVDVGSAFVAGGGTENDGIGMGSLTASAPFPLMQGLEISNVIVLMKNATSLFHGIIIENGINPIIENCEVIFGTHGIVTKGIGGIIHNVKVWDNHDDAIILKSNTYANSWASQISDFEVGALFGSDAGGIIIQNDGAPAQSGVKVSNGTIRQASFGITTLGECDNMEIVNVKALAIAGIGFDINTSAFTRLSDCYARGCTGDGFNVNVGMNHIMIADCESVGNGGDGFDLTSSSGIVDVDNIVARSNTGYGLNAGSNVWLKNRTLTTNTAGSINGTPVLIFPQLADNNTYTGTNTFNNQVSITSSSNPALTLTHNFSGPTLPFTAFSPNLSAGQYTQFQFGRSLTAYNYVGNTFFYTSSGSVNNLYYLGYENGLHITAGGRASIGYAANTAPTSGMTLDVNGKALIKTIDSTSTPVNMLYQDITGEIKKAAVPSGGGTVNVAGGGTGNTSFTPYAVIAGGTTSTGALQQVSGVGTAGQVLTSNGAGALPTWQAAPGGGGGGIYDGSGSLSTNTTVSGASNSLTLGASGDKLSTLTTNVTGTSTYNSDAHTFNDGTGHSFGMSNAGFFSILGSLNVKVQRATDANTSNTTSSCVWILPDITTNRTFSFPLTAREGMIYIVINTNTTGNTWQFGGGGTLVDEGGASVTSFTNSKTYIIMGDNTANVYRIIKQ